MEIQKKRIVKPNRTAGPRQYSKLIRTNDAIAYTKNLSLLDVKERRIIDLNDSLNNATEREDRDYYIKEIKKTEVGMERLKKAVDALEDLVDYGFEEDTIEYAYNQKVNHELLDSAESRTRIHEDYAGPIKYYQDKICDYEKNTKILIPKLAKRMLSYVPAVAIGGSVAAGAQNYGLPTTLSLCLGGAATSILICAEEVIIALAPHTGLAEKFERNKINEYRKEIRKLRGEEDLEKSILYQRLIDNVNNKYLTYKKDMESLGLLHSTKKLRVIKKKKAEAPGEETTTTKCDILDSANMIHAVQKIYENEQEQNISPSDRFDVENEKRHAFHAQQKKDYIGRDDASDYLERE